MRRFRGVALVAAIILIAVAVGPASVLADDDHQRLRAEPWIFVGKAGDCGTGYAAGSRIVTSAWLGGMGLPDNGGLNSNTTDPTNNPNKRDPHFGLLLNKNGPTPDCSSAGATIRGVRGLEVDATFAIGYDSRNGAHCSGGAPRFNVVTNPPGPGPNTFHFVGACTNDTAPTPAPQDPLEWTRYRYEAANAGEWFPVAVPGSKIVSINIVFDEGTDTPGVQDPMGIGLAVIDNIYIDGRDIRAGIGIEPGGGRRDDDDHGGDGDDDDD